VRKRRGNVETYHGKKTLAQERCPEKKGDPDQFKNKLRSQGYREEPIPMADTSGRKGRSDVRGAVTKTLGEKNRNKKRQQESKKNKLGT